MRTLVLALLLGAAAAAGVVSLGATKDHTGNRVTTDLVSAICSDAAHKAVANVGEILHEHVEEIEENCSSLPEGELKVCEDKQVAGLARAQKNVTLFYIQHCAEHVKEDLGGKAPTLELAHPAADNFEKSHADEIKNVLHEQMHQEMAKGETGPMTTPEVLCMIQVGKDLEKDGDLLHEHLDEVEEGCKAKSNVSACEWTAVKALIKGKGVVMQKFVDHCLQPATWSLQAMHAAMDNFGEVHKPEVQEALHDQIHTAMSSAGLEAEEHFAVEAVAWRGGGPRLLGAGGALAFSAAVGAAALLVWRRRAGAPSSADGAPLAAREEGAAAVE